MEHPLGGERIQQGGRRYFSVLWKRSPGYEKEALEAGNCPFYLPVRFVEDRGNLTAWYDDTGYLSLKTRCQKMEDRRDSPLRFVVSVFRNLAEGEEEAEDFLLAGDGILYNSNCIFIEEKSEAVKIAYIPTNAKRLFSQRLLSLCRELQEENPGRGLDALLEKLEEKQKGEPGGTAALLRLLSRWEREL